MGKREGGTGKTKHEEARKENRSVQFSNWLAQSGNNFFGARFIPKTFLFGQNLVPLKDARPGQVVFFCSELVKFGENEASLNLFCQRPVRKVKSWILCSKACFFSP